MAQTVGNHSQQLSTVLEYAEEVSLSLDNTSVEVVAIATLEQILSQEGSSRQFGIRLSSSSAVL